MRLKGINIHDTGERICACVGVGVGGGARGIREFMYLEYDLYHGMIHTHSKLTYVLKFLEALFPFSWLVLK